MDEKIAKLFLPLLDRLYNSEPAGEPFRKPVDVVKYGCFDYYLYVKHPIDLSTIRERLTSHQYKDAWRFIADIQLMFSNAYLFNKKGTPVYEFTNKLSRIWTSEYPTLMQKLNYCCGSLHKFGPQLLFCHGTTPDRYCQIPIGAKYKCYDDQYSFCIPCFNKIRTDYINIQNLSCETTRMKLPTQPVAKYDFLDCTNDNWQYETFIQCAQCTRRVHQICQLYPADDHEVNACIQHSELEDEQRSLCKIPEEELRRQRGISQISEGNTEIDSKLSLDIENVSEGDGSQIKKEEIEEVNISSGDDQNAKSEPDLSGPMEGDIKFVPSSLDDELLQLAYDVDDLTNSAPNSPNPDSKRLAFSCAKNEMQKQTSNNNIDQPITLNEIDQTTSISSNLIAKTSVDKIADRLSSQHKATIEPVVETTSKSVPSDARDRFVCNYCYRKKKIGFNLRHRKYSARRLPHTRMSRYIETKVNEYIKDNAPSAGEVTIRVLATYGDTMPVKPQMQDYVNKCREREDSHPFLKDYPKEFKFTNRAVFAWQEIDGVDVCVFGMHVQEYGEDCPEPNRQVIYLSYLDSVHFFRPKSVRTAVYHEILLSYFKYVRKLGFRRIFIWVCPSRKGDDYIFYRHPSEQKMPTLKRLADWYTNLLDKGIMSGIIERHETLHNFATSQASHSILSMPYLSGDYWPGEFERLLKIMIESQQKYEEKMKQLEATGESRDSIFDVSDNVLELRNNNLSVEENYEYDDYRLNLKPKTQPIDDSHKNKQCEFLSFLRAYHSQGTNGSIEQGSSHLPFQQFNTPKTREFDADQPLDLSKASSNVSPDSFLDEDVSSELSFRASGNRKKRRRLCSMGYPKKRGRVSATQQVPRNQSLTQAVRSSSQIIRNQSRPINRNSKDTLTETIVCPETELFKQLERSLKRQREGFIVARMNDCDCSPHFETQRRKEEVNLLCSLMVGREPFLQLARLKNYEFSTLRRAKFSSLAMVKHLSQTFDLEPICNECYSFDSSKCHLGCLECNDFYLCTSCYQNTHHDHPMQPIAPTSPPNIDDFLQQCSTTPSLSESISSASSTISNKSFNDSSFDISSIAQSVTPTLAKVGGCTPNDEEPSKLSKPINMPLGCQRQNNNDFSLVSRAGDEENSNLRSFNSSSKFSISNRPTPPPSHSNHALDTPDVDKVFVDNFMRQAEVTYDVDFDHMKDESKKLLAHYWGCPMKDACHRCKFVVFSCSFMSAFMRNSRIQLLMGRSITDMFPVTCPNNNNPNGVNLTKAHQLSDYRSRDK